MDTDKPKKPSGAEFRKRRRGAVTEAGADPLDTFDAEISAALRNLGRPPTNDPLRLTEWHAALTGIVAWAYAIGQVSPGQHVRLRGMLEAVRSGGMVAVKAQERKRQREVAARIGAVKDTDDGLDEFPGSSPLVG